MESGAQSVLHVLRKPEAQDDLVRDESRADWYLSTVEKMVRNHELTPLRFLDRTQAERLVDDSGQPWSISILPVAEVAGALDALNQVLQIARLDPTRMVPYFSGLESTEADVRDALIHPREVDGDEGLGPHYLFSHLDDLRGLLSRAAEAGLGIAHVRYLYE